MSLWIIITIILLWFAFVITGIILLITEKKKWGTTLLIIPFLILVGIIIYFKSYFASTTPDSLSIQAKPQGNVITITGKWKDHLEKNILGTDVLIFYAPNNTPIQGTRFPNLDNELDDYIVFVLQQFTDLQLQGEPQLYDVKVSETFQHHVTLPDGLDAGDVTIYYMHLVDEFPDPYKWMKVVYP